MSAGVDVTVGAAAAPATEDSIVKKKMSRSPAEVVVTLTVQAETEQAAELVTSLTGRAEGGAPDTGAGPAEEPLAPR